MLKTHKRWSVAVAVIVASAVLAVAGITVRSVTEPKFFSTEAQKQAGFPLYHPARLPEGYKADKTTVSMVASVVTYQIKHAAKEPLLVSLQPRPNNFDVESFNKEVISEGISLTVPAGTATIGRLRENQVASVLTNETWVLISDPNLIPQQDLKFIVQNLTLSGT